MEVYQPTYWNQKGKYQKEYDLLSEVLIPFQGEACTKQGQFLSCISNIYHERYNNGWGNPIGHYTKFIRKYAKSKKLDIRIVKELTRQEFDKEVDKVMKHLIETVVEPLGENDKIYERDYERDYDEKIFKCRHKLKDADGLCVSEPGECYECPEKKKFKVGTEWAHRKITDVEDEMVQWENHSSERNERHWQSWVSWIKWARKAERVAKK